MTARTYFYCRVSTAEQTTENQVQAFRTKGYDVADDFVIEETISGSVAAMERPQFRAMVEHKLMKGDTLVVLKLDRLGRSNIDVQNTIQMLHGKGISVHSLDLPTNDLTTSEGRLMMQMFTAFAEFERNRLSERTIEGQERARKQGKVIGRPVKATPQKVAKLRRSKGDGGEGLSASQAAERLGVSLSTIKRLSAEAKKLEGEV
ncbi:recombinase family protein [Ferrimonas balearica]|uniref:recombinase family protein n=1 Tax=Ferrimonas balearica TaxID=44012 RepID=UPI001C97F7EE|nr:recombinase family protein [Ferrimonas balearica]MBY5981266.1 recombinase family protein [Ferrimonas balearica]